jgi:hypothetical protein
MHAILVRVDESVKVDSAVKIHVRVPAEAFPFVVVVLPVRRQQGSG